MHKGTNPPSPVPGLTAPVLKRPVLVLPVNSTAPPVPPAREANLLRELDRSKLHCSSAIQWTVQRSTAIMVQSGWVPYLTYLTQHGPPELPLYVSPPLHSLLTLNSASSIVTAYSPSLPPSHTAEAAAD